MQVSIRTGMENKDEKWLKCGLKDMVAIFLTNWLDGEKKKQHHEWAGSPSVTGPPNHQVHTQRNQGALR